MANAFLTPDNLATLAAKLVGGDLRLASLFSRDLEKDFRGRKGATISVPIPGALPVETRGIFDKTTAIVHHEISEQTLSVTLDEHLYSSVLLSAGDLDLDIQSFTDEVLLPQCRAISAGIERRAVAALKATPATTFGTYDPTNPAKLFTAARAKLRANGIPDSSRLLAVAGVGVEANLLDGPANTFDANGRVRGFEVTYSNRLTAGEVVFFVPEAFVTVVRAPEVPEGAPYGASVRTKDENAFAIRHIRSFDGSVAADQSLLSVFVEVTAAPLPVVDDVAGTVTLVANAGAVRVNTGS